MKSIIISIAVATILIAGAFMFVQKSERSNDSIPISNVIIENGKQIIEIKAKGGYFPRKSVAQAGIPTILRFDTNGTFDCSASVRIPSMNISKMLPQTGNTDIDLGNPKLSTLQGTCGMGMYPFEVEFRN